MTYNFVKYSQLALLVLLLGFGLNRNVQVGVSCIPDDKMNGGAYVAENPKLDGLQIVMISSAASIASEEITRVDGSQQSRDFFKLSHVCLKGAVNLSRYCKTQSYIDLLSTRYEQGFYLYTLKKLII